MNEKKDSVNATMAEVKMNVTESERGGKGEKGKGKRETEGHLNLNR